MSDNHTIDVAVATVEKAKLEPPKKWNVVILDDNVTTMDFVVMVLMEIFHKDFGEAADIMFDVHEKGRGLAGTYFFEVAEQKMEESVAAARQNNFPLQVVIEPTE